MVSETAARTHPFNPGLARLALALALAGLFAGLGLWQLERAAQKEALAVAIAARQAAPPLVWSGANDAELRYRNVRLEGRFDGAQTLLLDNRRHEGRPGYQVVTPFRFAANGDWVLVNRGWVAAVDGRPPPVTTPSGPIAIGGRLDRPVEPLLSGAPEAAWEGPWPWLDLERVEARLDAPLARWVVLQDPADPDGFVRAWPRFEPRTAMHIGYAMQWFAFAAIAAVICVRSGSRRERGGGNDG